jgi:hypothetical protein
MAGNGSPATVSGCGKSLVSADNGNVNAIQSSSEYNTNENARAASRIGGSGNESTASLRLARLLRTIMLGVSKAVQEKRHAVRTCCR